MNDTAVQALLSRVYLYVEDWMECINYSDKVIANTSRAYGKSYLDMFNGNYVPGEALLRLNGYLKSSKIEKFYSLTDPVAYPADTLFTLLNNPDDIRMQLYLPV